MDPFEVFERDADSQPFASIFFPDFSFPQPSPPIRKLKEGYPIDRFAASPPSEFVCVVCYNVVRNPKECRSCGVLICERCIENYKEVRRQNPRYHNNPHFEFACPHCREQSEPRSPSKVLMSIIGEMEVFCKHRSNGCLEKRQLRDISSHEKSCSYKKIRCAYCGREGQKEEFRVVAEESHRKYSCSEACEKTLALQKLLQESRREDALRMYFELLKEKEGSRQGEVGT